MFSSSGGTRIGNEYFDMQRKTMLYIHGYAEESKYESVRAIVDAYLQRTDYNVLALDWSELASGNYLIDAVPNAKQVNYIDFLLSSLSCELGISHLKTTPPYKQSIFFCIL